MTTCSDMMPRMRLAENGPDDDDDLLPSEGMGDAGFDLPGDGDADLYRDDDDGDPRELEF